jgi:hypothetical protein
LFNKWAEKEGLSNDTLRAAVDEMERGLIDADLCGHVMKKRVAVGGRGKRGGVRTLLAYKSGDRAFFVYGFAKNVRTNVNTDELKALKHLAKELLSYSDKTLTKAIQYGALVEVETMDKSILEVVHDSAKDLNKAGTMKETTLREFDALCLPPVKEFGCGSSTTTPNYPDSTC